MVADRGGRCFGSAKCGKALFKIRDNVIYVLGSNGEPDGVGLDTLVQQLLLRELGVSGGCGMDHQALDVCHVCKQREDLQMIDEIPCFLLSALDLKSEDRGASVGEIPSVKRVIRVVGK